MGQMQIHSKLWSESLMSTYTLGDLDLDLDLDRRTKSREDFKDISVLKLWLW